MLQKFRRTVLANSPVKVANGTCHDEHHKRFRPSADRRERHKHLPILMSGAFAHKKLAAVFHKEHGLHISFSFHLKRFGGNLRYCMEAGKKPSTDLDLQPAKFPANLCLKEEQDSAVHPGEAPKKESKKRKRLSFDEVSNIILEGLDDGPLKSGRALEKAAKKLKLNGQVELWNYVGECKSALEVNTLVAKAWRLHGVNQHPLWRARADYDLTKFNYERLPALKAWRNGKHASHALILSGDGGLGKTNLAEALVNEKCPSGYWFVDDPDDFRELEGLLEPGQGIVIDEITLASYSPNQIKKLFDIEKARRIKCRHFNGTIPKGCLRIFCTNSEKEKFYPKIEDKNDRTGVFRRQLFQKVGADVRHLPAKGPNVEARVAVGLNEPWRKYLHGVCAKASLTDQEASLVSSAMELGVALAAEVKQHAVQLAVSACLKPLERARFLRVVSPGDRRQALTSKLTVDEEQGEDGEEEKEEEEEEPWDFGIGEE